MLLKLHSVLFGFGILISVFYYLLGSIAFGQNANWHFYIQPLIIFLVLAIRLTERGWKLHINLNPADWGLLLLTAYAFFTIPIGASSVKEAFQLFFTFFFGSLAYWYARYSEHSIQFIWRYAKNAFIIGGLISSFALIYQWQDPNAITILLDDQGSEQELSFSRDVFGTFSEFRLTGLSINPTHVATLLALSLILVIFSTLSIHIKIVISAVLFFSSLLTDSRLPLLVAIVLSLIFLRLFDRWRVIATLGSAVVISLIGGVFLFDDLVGAGGVLSLPRLGFILGNSPIQSFFGRLHETGANVPLGIQVGAWEQGYNILGILDSQYLWIYFEFGVVGTVATLIWLRGAWIGAFASNDRAIRASVIFILIISVKQYPMIDKSMYVFAYFLIGTAVTYYVAKAKGGSIV